MHRIQALVRHIPVAVAVGLLTAMLGAGVGAAAVGGSAAQAAAGLKQSSGLVTGTGSIGAGSGFTVVHAAPGEYIVKYPSATFTKTPAMTVTGYSVSGPVPIAVIQSVSLQSGAANFDILIFSQNGVQFDNAFMFTLITTK